MQHFLSARQLTVKEIYTVLETAECYRKKEKRINKQVFAANLFFEPSTRTKSSFFVAQKRLGIETLDFDLESSSVRKGESLYDTAKTFESIGAGLLVIRHQSDSWFEELTKGISIPIINAGAGKEEHPTQCMLDLMTIYQEFGCFTGLKIAIVGDILHSRVAHSNAFALSMLGAEVYLTAASGFEDEELDFPYITIDEAVESCDVVMLLRIQHERHLHKAKTFDYLSLYGLTKERESRMKQQAIILHPAPINRGVEIDTDLVECNRSRIFKQMENGVYVRMAIMMNVLNEWGIIHENTFEKRTTITTGKQVRSM